MKSRKRRTGRAYVGKEGKEVYAGGTKGRLLKVHPNGSLEVKFGEDKGTTPDMKDKSKVKARKDSKGTFSPYAVSLVEKDGKPKSMPKCKRTRESDDAPTFF